MGVAVATEPRALLVSRGWVQATPLIVLCGFFILGLLAYRTYLAHPPVPQRVVDSQGRIVYTGRRGHQRGSAGLRAQRADGVRIGVRAGAYLGPDFTADYLRRSSDLVKRSCGGADSDSAGRKTIEDFRTNRYDENTKTLTLTPAQGDARHGKADSFWRASVAARATASSPRANACSNACLESGISPSM
jgi:nitric oxide reductase subunit B